MANRFRNRPTAEGSKALRAALKSLDISARVATQPYAYRVVSDDERTLSALVSLGFEGPTGGQPVRNGINSYFAYEFTA
jgi:hypothetical protein